MSHSNTSSQPYFFSFTIGSEEDVIITADQKKTSLQQHENHPDLIDWVDVLKEAYKAETEKIDEIEQKKIQDTTSRDSLITPDTPDAPDTSSTPDELDTPCTSVLTPFDTILLYGPKWVKDSILTDACFDGHLTIVQRLIESGIEISENAIHGACAGGSLNILKYFQTHVGDLEYRILLQQCSEHLHLAIRTKNIPLIMHVLQFSYYSLDWAFYNACYVNYGELIELLIAQGVNNWEAGLKGAIQGHHYDLIDRMIEKERVKKWDIFLVATQECCSYAVNKILLLAEQEIRKTLKKYEQEEMASRDRQLCEEEDLSLGNNFVQKWHFLAFHGFVCALVREDFVSAVLILQHVNTCCLCVDSFRYSSKKYMCQLLNHQFDIKWLDLKPDDIMKYTMERNQRAEIVQKCLNSIFCSDLLQLCISFLCYE
jgi:hypothetical protein